MSDAVALALVAAVAPTLAAVAGLFVSIHNARRLVEVHTLTNDTLSQTAKARDVAQATVKAQEVTIAALRLAAGAKAVPEAP